jgi:acetylornithine deacetylase/succinyl-diaminopimelate desuccinylase-like protein
MENAVSSDLEQRIFGAVDEATWVALASELVRAGQPDAENPLDPDQPSGREEGIASLVAEKLAAIGLAVETHALEPGRPNVIGTLAGRSPDGPTLILNDHLDTYPAGDPAKWTRTGGDPYRPTRIGDRLYGRGTSDTRANLACTLLAVDAVRKAGIALEGTVKCVYTVDEEKNGPKGALYLLGELGLRADYEITCEPTAWTGDDGSWGIGVGVANAGHALLTLKVEGVKSHLWRPDTGVNAVLGMAKLLARLSAIEFTHEPPALYGGTRPTIAILRVSGGKPRELQFTPDESTAVLGVVGIVPGMTLGSILADIRAVLAAATAEQPGLTATVEPYPGSLFVNATHELHPDAEPAAALRRAYARVIGGEPRIYRKNAYNDTIRFAEAGIPSITFGPGEDGWPPDNEYIGIAKSIAATKILALTIVELLGVAESPQPRATEVPADASAG